jgi:FtsP/CotA-like multicopper oxidase with cupredoxin domain
MRSQKMLSIVAPVLAALLAFSPIAIEADYPDWNIICHIANGQVLRFASLTPAARAPVAKCGPVPSTFRELPSVGGDGDTSVDLSIGYDPDTDHLCYVTPSLPETPVIRVGVGHTLTISLTNTLHDAGPGNETNCPIDTFGGEQPCLPLPYFDEKPGADGKFYPLEANEAHEADGTSNLHVHGMFVSPQPCSDEVLKSTIYPANWEGPLAPMPPCQTAPNSLAYTYHIPDYAPAGLYWFHSHRHGEAEVETQMGLVGALVVEDSGDAWRRSIGVTDEVLVIDDTPRSQCAIGNGCDSPRQPAFSASSAHRLSVQQAAREAAAKEAAAGAAPVTPSAGPQLDPRIDQVDQYGECASGAYGAQGGTELWTLNLNGAAVPENLNGTFPPDSELLRKTMRPGQRQIFRLVVAGADSFVAPQLVLSQNGVETVQKLEVFARDGVGLADAQGKRHFGYFDVSKGQFIAPPAGRVEFVVHAPPVGAKLYLQSAEVDPGCGGNAYPNRRLLLITSAGTPVDPGAPDDSDLLEHTPSLAPYLSILSNKPTVFRTLVFAEYTRAFTYGVTKWVTGPPTTADYNPGATDFYIVQVAANDGEVNPQKTAMIPFLANTLTPQVVVHLHGKDSVTEEWLVENSTLEIHDFHMHQVHFRDITVDSTNPDLQPILDSDVLPAAPLIGNAATGGPGAPGYLKLLMTFTKQDIGEFVFHCHILEHEDNGMMAKIKVVAD